MLVNTVAKVSRAGMSREQFEHYYETVHSKQAHYIKHLIASCERNYPTEGYAYGDGNGIDAAVMAGRPVPEFDCVTRMTSADRAAFEKVRPVLLDPKIEAGVEKDEEALFDRRQMTFYICETPVTHLEE